jgi:predicted transcriptional regulator
MARKTHNHRLDLPPLELDCMKTLWALGQGTVQEIRDQLFPKRPLAYTTVMTVMDRLAHKGVVEREKRGRAHVYRPSITEASVRDRAIARLSENFFQSSPEALRRYLERSEIALAGVSSRRRDGRRSADGDSPGSLAIAVNEKDLDTTLL